MMFLLVECPDPPSVALGASLRGESAESGLIIGGSTASLSTCERATCGTEAGSFTGEGTTLASELGGLSGKTTIFPVSFIESSSVALSLVCAFAGKVDNLGLYAIYISTGLTCDVIVNVGSSTIEEVVDTALAESDRGLVGAAYRSQLSGSGKSSGVLPGNSTGEFVAGTIHSLACNAVNLFSHRTYY